MPVPIFLRKRGDPTDSSAPGPAKPGEPIWIIKDDFLDAQSTLTGTPARPGGSPGSGISQLRTETDTNGVISTISGALNFATGAVTFDGVWYASHARTAGRAALFKITQADVTSYAAVGFDTDTTTGIADAMRIRTTIGLQLVINISTSLTVGAYTAGITYYIAPIMRSTGVHWFIKGGAFTTWTLLMVTALGSAAGFPAIQAQNTTSIFTAGFIRTADLGWLAAPWISDSFTTSSSDGAGHAEATGIGAGGSGIARTGATWANSGVTTNSPTLGPELMSDGGFTTEAYWTTSSTWTVVGGVGVGAATTGTITENVLTTGSWYSAKWTLATFSTGAAAAYIGGNCVSRTTAATYIDTDIAGNGNAGIYGLNFSGTVDDLSVKKLELKEIISPYVAGAVKSPDYLAGIRINRLTTGAAAGMMLNIDITGAPTNGLLVWHNGTNVKLVNLASGTYTSLLNVANAYTTNTTLWVHRMGTAARVYAETSAGAISLIGAATPTTNTNLYVAPMSCASTNQLDNFVIYPAGTSGEYETQLNRFIA